MKERPILFSGAMVRAILAGTKTQTRRAVKLPADAEWHVAQHQDGRMWPSYHYDDGGPIGTWHWLACPYGDRGDRLWVRETFCHYDGQGLGYRADMKPDYKPSTGWRVSIHMPRWASRLTLEVVTVRVERLQEISIADATAEGIEPEYPGGREIVWPDRLFPALWNSINSKRGFGWDTNPWVWVIEFKRIEQARRAA